MGIISWFINQRSHHWGAHPVDPPKENGGIRAFWSIFGQKLSWPGPDCGLHGSDGSLAG